MIDRPGVPVPDPEELDEVQEKIEERLDTGAVEAAATEL